MHILIWVLTTVLAFLATRRTLLISDIMTELCVCDGSVLTGRSQNNDKINVF